jgi:hypothetical protein
VPGAATGECGEGALDVQQSGLLSGHDRVATCCFFNNAAGAQRNVADTQHALPACIPSTGPAASITQRICLSVSDGTSAALKLPLSLHSNEFEESQ